MLSYKICAQPAAEHYLQLPATMKRKLDEDDVPTAVDEKDAFKKPSNFNALGLDPRLLQAVAEQNFSAPTPVQSRAIPLALEGKDILGMGIVNMKEKPR